jgi:hypothetical protein
LDPEAVETFGLIFGFGEEAIQSFKLPEALEVFAVQALAVFFNESLGFFVVRLVAHLAILPFFDSLTGFQGTQSWSVCFLARTSPNDGRD